MTDIPHIFFLPPNWRIALNFPIFWTCHQEVKHHKGDPFIGDVIARIVKLYISWYSWGKTHQFLKIIITDSAHSFFLLSNLRGVGVRFHLGSPFIGDVFDQIKISWNRYAKMHSIFHIMITESLYSFFLPPNLRIYTKISNPLIMLSWHW